MHLIDKGSNIVRTIGNNDKDVIDEMVVLPFKYTHVTKLFTRT